MIKLVLAIVQDQDAGRVVDALTGEGYQVTRINTVGGFLRRGNVSSLVGVDEAKVDHVIETIDLNCEARISDEGEVPVGAGTVFVLTVDEVARV